MGLKSASYQDEEGRNWRVLLPDDVPEAFAEQGMPDGPPSLASLGLPLATEVRLHNELFNRGLFSEAQLRRNRAGVLAALMAALAVDVERIFAVYRDLSEDDNAHQAESAAREPVASVHPRGRRAARS